MSSSDRAGVLLSSIIICVDTLIIVEVNVVNIFFGFDLVSSFMLHGRHLAHALGQPVCVHQAVLQDGDLLGNIIFLTDVSRKRVGYHLLVAIPI